MNGAVGAACGSIFGRLFQVIKHAEAAYTNGTLDHEWLRAEMLGFAFTFLLVGIFLMISSGTAVSCFHIASIRTIAMIRRRLLFAELNKRPHWDPDFYQKYTIVLDTLQRGTGIKFVFVTQAFTTAFFGVVIGLAFNWKLTLFLVFMFPFVVPLDWLPDIVTSRLKSKEAAAYEVSNSIAIHSALDSGIPLLPPTTSLEEQFAKNAEEGLRFATQKAVFSTAFGGVYYTLMLAYMSVGAWFGINLIWNSRDTHTTGEVLTVFWLVFVGAVRVGQAAPQIGAIWAAMSAGSSLLKELEPTASLNDTLVPDCRMKRASICSQPDGIRAPFRVQVTPLMPAQLQALPVVNGHVPEAPTLVITPPRHPLVRAALKLGGKEMNLLLVCTFLTVLRACVWPLFTWTLSIFFDVLNDHSLESPNGFLFFSVLLGVLALLGGLLNFSASAVVTILGERIARRCRSLAFEQRAFNQTVGRKLKNLLCAPPQIQIAVDTRTSDILQASLALVLTLYVCFFQCWQMAVVEVVVILLFEFAQFRIVAHLFPRVCEMFETEEQILDLVTDGFHSPSTPIKILREEFNQLADKADGILKRVGFFEAFAFSIGMCLEGVNFALVYALGIFFYQDLGFSPMSFFQVAQLISGGMLISIIPTASYVPELVRGLAATSRLFRSLANLEQAVEEADDLVQAVAA
ncbi:Multidrug resistance protein pgp-3 [Aphelenchoides fujianensis]|nr:Multidrug resistance protein pgp-3 [Aphelenchoides fujianensis]